MKKIPALFYKNSNDKKPVRDWLLELSENDRKIIGQDIATVEYAYPVGMPTCRSLGNKLEEVRSDISDKRIARVIFSIKCGYIILLHGFIKKTQKTPKNEIDIALKRLKEIECE